MCIMQKPNIQQVLVVCTIVQPSETRNTIQITTLNLKSCLLSPVTDTKINAHSQLSSHHVCRIIAIQVCYIKPMILKITCTNHLPPSVLKNITPKTFIHFQFSTHQILMAPELYFRLVSFTRIHPAKKTYDLCTYMHASQHQKCWHSTNHMWL